MPQSCPAAIHMEEGKMKVRVREVMKMFLEQNSTLSQGGCSVLATVLLLIGNKFSRARAM